MYPVLHMKGLLSIGGEQPFFHCGKLATYGT